MGRCVFIEGLKYVFIGVPELIYYFYLNSVKSFPYVILRQASQIEMNPKKKF